MGFWNKLGKIALQAAPYVAAPFTGGASLMATGVTQKLGQKWAESDAKKAAAKGLAPSKFDKYLGMASAGAGLASSIFAPGGALSGAGKAGTAAGAAGKAASAAGTASKAGNLSKIASAAIGKNVGGWQGAVGKLAADAAINKVTGGSVKSVDDAKASSGWEGQLAGLLQQASSPSAETPVEAAPVDNRAAGSVNGFPLNQGQPKARNYNPIDAGRNAALMSQPWRVGYETRAQGPEDENGNPTVITNQNPAIYPNYNPPVQSPPVSEDGNQSGSIFGDQLTPRIARRRNPAPVEEMY